MATVFFAEIDRAADAVARADALLIAAGAGMGVDSGMPDFRGGAGFWQAYPAAQKLGLAFEDLANPRWFRDDPTLAWGFYGHRLNLYRETRPHQGFEVLRAWSERAPHGAFVYTSNVDGQFQSAGFDGARVVECHGSIHHMQCVRECGQALWSVDAGVEVDAETLRAAPPLPSCPHCGGLARPNILMFGDADWDDGRVTEQYGRYSEWQQQLRAKKARVVVIECGAGKAIPTVRLQAQRVARELGGLLVRINVREPEVPAGQIGLAMGAKAALTAIDERVAALR
ncbi:MAG TPA: Sir2 family NAD-dependent protein deacetylase [Nannocystis sp.]